MRTTSRPEPLSIPPVETVVADLARPPVHHERWDADVACGPVSAMALEPALGVVAVGRRSGMVQVLDDRGRPVATCFTEGHVVDLAFSPDGQYLTALDVVGTVHRVDWSAGRTVVDGLRPAAPADGGRPALSPDGRRTAHQTVDGIAIWDIESQARLATSGPRDALAGSMAFDGDGERLAVTRDGRSGAPSRSIRQSNGYLARLPRQHWRRSVVEPPRLGEGRPTDRIEVLTCADAAPVDLPERTRRFPGEVLAMPDERTLVLRRGLHVESIDPTTATRLGPSIKLPRAVEPAEVRGDLVACTTRGWWLLDWRTGEVLAGDPWEQGGPDDPARPVQVCVDPGRSRVVVAEEDGLVWCHEVDLGR